MNTIMSLVKADFLKLKNLRGINLAFLILPIGIAALGPSGLLMAMIIGSYGLIYLVPAYEEQSNAQYLYGTLPISRKQIVDSKFVFSVICLAGLFIMCTAASYLSPSYASSEGSLLLSGLSGLVLSMVFASFMLPLHLCLGSNKARFLVIIVYMSIFIITNFAGNSATKLLANLPPMTPLVIVLGSVVLFYLSYCLTCFFYNKKEYR